MIEAEISNENQIPQQTSIPEIRFIKLGRGGRWELDCITGPIPCIRLGFDSNQHEICLQGDWEAVYDHMKNVKNKSIGKAREYTNQVRQFYTLSDQTIWITFYNRKLYWCRADSEVIELPDKSRIRKTIGNWSSTDQLGQELYLDNLSGVLTKVQGFRGTICRIDAGEYLWKRLNGLRLPEVVAAEQSLLTLQRSLVPLIRLLGWKDFELLTDLVFTQAGWQRISALGKTEKSIDLDLVSPVTNKRAFVQVKSQANLSTFLSYKNQFEEMSQYDEMYFVVHSPTRDLESYEDNSRVVLLTVDRLAKLLVSAGLTTWLIRKVS